MQSNLNLSVSDLCIERSDKFLCENLSFQVESGEIWHILGENGAGKSSLLKVLAGLLQPYTGTLFFSGEDISKHRDVLHAELFYLGHKTGVKSIFTPIENLQMYFPSHTVEHIQNALAIVNLSEYEDTPAFQLSAGQQRRIALAKLWLTSKSVWLLDEPFTSLDSYGIQILEARIEEHAKAGGMIMLTSHQKLSSQLDFKELDLGA